MMKYFFYILLFVFNASLLTAQDSLSPPVAKYLQFLKNEAAPPFEKDKITLTSFSDLRHIARIIYEAYENDPFVVHSTMGIQNREFDSLITKRKPGESIGRMYNAVEIDYLRRIDTILSKRIFALVESSCIVEVRIDSVEKFINRPFRGTHMKGMVIEAFKCDKKLITNDEIKCYYYDYWAPTQNIFIPATRVLCF